MSEVVMIKKVWAIFSICCCPFFAFTQDTARIGIDTVFCGDTRIVFYNRCYDDTARKISFVHVHENETTAVAAANQLIDSSQNGCFVTWQCHQQRFVDFEINGVHYRFDPNRIFTKTGINATLGSTRSAYSDSATLAVKKVADVFLKKYVDSNRLVVALHNNINAGGLTIHSYKKGGAYSKDAKQVFINIKQDADDFFYTTESEYFNFLKGKGFNVVLQNNAGVKDDGSLSVYCATRQIPYINIEAQDGHLPQQLKMLNVVVELINRLIE